MFDKNIKCLLAGLKAILPDIDFLLSRQNLQDTEFPVGLLSWGGSSLEDTPVNPNVRDCRYIDARIMLNSEITIYDTSSIGVLNKLTTILLGSNAEKFKTAIMATAKAEGIPAPAFANIFSGIQQADFETEDNQFIYAGTLSFQWDNIISYDQGQIPALGDIVRADKDIKFTQDDNDPADFIFSYPAGSIAYNTSANIYAVANEPTAEKLYINGRAYALTEATPGTPSPKVTVAITETADQVSAMELTKTLNLQYADGEWLYTFKSSQDININISGKSRTVNVSKAPLAKF